MIDRIYGQIEIDIPKIGKSAPHRMVVLTSSGVGYEVLCSSSSIRQYIEFIQHNVEPMRYVLIYEHVAEKMPTKLYGFFDDSERALFEDLLDVDGVGPKCALGICSLDSPNNVRQAIRLQNADYLRRAAGVGQKAEKIVLKLAPRMGA
jgi:holliday junction DNA helicase RuvA